MNVIHRDLNPSNVFLCFKSKDKNKIDERSVKIKIIDFNVSKKCIKNEQEEKKE
jgi:serine/threonine protein kinase